MLEALLAGLQGLLGTTGVSPLRQRLLGMIEEKPGQHAMALCRDSGESWSTVQYHLDLLRKGDMVTSVDAGRTRRFFPSDVDDRRAKMMAMLREGRRPELAKFIVEHPGSRQVDICKEVGVSRKTFRNAIGPLVEEGMVNERRTLQNNQYFANEELAPFVHELGE